MITLTLTEEHVQIIWSLLGDAPLKVSLPVFKELERQIAEQKTPQPVNKANGPMEGRRSGVQ